MDPKFAPIPLTERCSSARWSTRLIVPMRLLHSSRSLPFFVDTLNEFPDHLGMFIMIETRMYLEQSSGKFKN